MFLPDLPHVLDRRSSMVTTSTPFDKSHFTLDTSGVSGFFGGDEAISAMATVHIYSGRQWLGWYNTPGSYQIAKKYGLVAKSVIFRGLFPGVRIDPARIFEFDGWQGPRFQAVDSGTIMDSTGHLASILMKECASTHARSIHGREGSSVGVTIVKLDTVPAQMVVPKRIFAYSPFLAIFPISVSLTTCIACAVYKDWYSFSLILCGILSNGISCLVIGSGALCFTHHIPAGGSPRGDGILGSGKELVLLQGEEGAVNSITVGRFSLKFPSERYEEYIGCCSFLLAIQFIAQLFLIPQGSLFGQIMFISSLAVSWVYNMYLATVDRERIQQRILLDDVLGKPTLTKYTLGSRTTAVVFLLCVLSPQNPRKLLDAYLPNDTKVWGTWKEIVVQRLLLKRALHFDAADWKLEGYTPGEQDLLQALYGDAQVAYNSWYGEGSPCQSSVTVAAAEQSEKKAS